MFYLFPGDPLDKLLSALDSSWGLLSAAHGPISIEEDGGSFVLSVEGIRCAVVTSRLEAVLVMAAALYVFAQKRPAALKNITIFIDLMVFGITKTGPVPARVQKVISEVSSM